MSAFSRRLRAVLLIACWVWASAMTGCGPQGAGTVEIGETSRWHKAPVAPSTELKRKGLAKSVPVQKDTWKSVKDSMKQLGDKSQ